MMRDLGCDDAINLDGGGSSTMLARLPGDADPIVVNSPSDGGERLTPNGIGFLRPEGSGELEAIDVESLNNLSAGPDVSREQDHRVLAGMSRVLIAQGMDEAQDPAPITRVRWTHVPSRPARMLWAGGDRAVVQGLVPGNVEVRAQQGGVTGTFPLRVLGSPVTLEASTSHIALANSGSSQTFTVTGRDADGWTAWIEPRDIDLTYDRNVLKRTETERGFRSPRSPRRAPRPSLCAPAVRPPTSLSAWA